MKFDAIIAYQTVDQELIELDAAVKKSPEARKYAQAIARRNDAGERYNKRIQEAKKLLEDFNAIKRTLAELSEKVDDFDGIVLDDVQEIKETEHYLTSITDILEQINQVEKRAGQLAKEIEAVTADARKIFELGVQAQEEVRKLKPAYDEKVAQLRPKAMELKGKLDSLAASVDEETMKKYIEIKKAAGLPAFVIYDSDPKSYWHGSCSVCHKGLSIAVESKLKKPGDFAECNSCGRVLYIPEG